MGQGVDVWSQAPASPNLIYTFLFLLPCDISRCSSVANKVFTAQEPDHFPVVELNHGLRMQFGKSRTGQFLG